MSSLRLESILISDILQLNYLNKKYITVEDIFLEQITQIDLAPKLEKLVLWMLDNE